MLRQVLRSTLRQSQWQSQCCAHARHLSTSSPAAAPAVNNLVVVGGGLMGGGIAQVSIGTGHKVVLVDVSTDVLNKSLRNINVGLQYSGKKQFTGPDASAKSKEWQKESHARLTTSTDLQEALAANGGAHLVIEAIVEKLDTKQELFEKLDKLAPPGCILTSNTSSLPVREIGARLCAERQKLFGGTHFFSPVPLMKLLEVVKVPTTSEHTFKTLVEFGKAVGKVCVSCNDTPGFIVNRLLLPYLMEAVRLVEREDASLEDVDIAMKNGAGYPMGPFELMDMVGIDVVKFIIDHWASRFPNDDMFKPSKLLDQVVAENRLGRKTGHGFYNYKK